MPKFIFAYHGGGQPETEEAGQKMMADWMAWIEASGPAMIDPGNPVGMSKTVTDAGVEDHGGANPISGYTMVEAADIDAAIEIAKGCPIVGFNGGTVEVAPIVQM